MNLKKFLQYLHDGHLFDEGLTVKDVAKKVGIGDNSVSTNFRPYLRVTIGKYIHQLRMEVADRLLREFNYSVAAAGAAVGIPGQRTFSRAFTRYCGDEPSAIQGKEMPPEVDCATWRRAFRGELELREGRKVCLKLQRVYPPAGKPGPPPDVTDIPANERWRAADVWEGLRDLPFEEQRAQVRGHAFRGTALFDLLREISRLAGRKDRQAGIPLADRPRQPGAAGRRGHRGEARDAAQGPAALRGGPRADRGVSSPVPGGRGRQGSD